MPKTTTVPKRASECDRDSHNSPKRHREIVWCVDICLNLNISLSLSSPACGSACSKRVQPYYQLEPRRDATTNHTLDVTHFVRSLCSQRAERACDGAIRALCVDMRTNVKASTKTTYIAWCFLARIAVANLRCCACGEWALLYWNERLGRSRRVCGTHTRGVRRRHSCALTDAPPHARNQCHYGDA